MLSTSDRMKFLLGKTGHGSTIELDPTTVRDLVDEIERLWRVESQFQAYRERMLTAAPYPFCHHPEKCIRHGRCKSEIVCND